MKLTIALPFFAAACFSVPQSPVPQQPSQGAIQTQQKAAFAQSMGYPTKKSPEELEATIQQQTKDFKRTGRTETLQLESIQPYVIEGVKGTCYTLVMHLGAGAAWGPGAEAGLRFDYRSASGTGSGGPGLIGPGAVASVGCADATGTITLTMAPMVGTESIGSGPIELELWSHKLTAQEAAHLEADKQRQIREQQDFAAREQAKRQERANAGCSKCDARYQGCIGAGRNQSVCRDEFNSCAFREVGADYTSACPNPRI